jgi:hypothetical protein
MKIAASLNPEDVAALDALADGIIPADATDAGAAAVSAGPRLAERIGAGVNAAVYRAGLDLARTLVEQQYGQSVRALTPQQVHDLLGLLRDRLPGFFKQLRMDVSSLYVSDPAVQRRIGFPGPSTMSGGYPDFHEPQRTSAKTPLTIAPPAQPERSGSTATTPSTTPQRGAG